MSIKLEETTNFCNEQEEYRVNHIIKINWLDNLATQFRIH
jgi:hypothetical protein